MNISIVIEKICGASGVPLTPQQIRERIKTEYSEFYSTPSHLRNIAKGHYKNADHALLAQIYIVVRASKSFFCDTSYKPMRISLKSIDNPAKVPVSVNANRHIFRQNPKTNYAKKIEEILINATEYHRVYYQAVVFSGPSLYFHQRAIDTSKLVDSLAHLEYVYAVLTSWGMHRLGAKGSKMVGFKEFRDSIQTLYNEITDAQNFTVQEMDEQKWDVLQKIFQGIRVMATSVSLVGNSKVMHHMLPNIIPPIDREYTLRYLRENRTIYNDLESEWLTMRDLVEHFFIPVVSDQTFKSMANSWLFLKLEYPWDTSMMKIVDNLIIGALKSS